ncbi:ogr/Delta-like zinc finger family protein [Paraburkholderia fungorum]|uniref:ogr/Delta-like zinc finger family protein n=1 Tax=Paraburkholderia fungorum TaxID=134537 RepID=UPI003877AADC
MRITIVCPHCSTRGIARAMEKESQIAWKIDFQCDDVTCGHTYRTRLLITPGKTSPAGAAVDVASVA